MWLPLLALVAISGVATLATEIYPALIVGDRFKPCSSAKHRNCVIDGDTFRLDGQTIRIADINAPEVTDPQCAAEAALGRQATNRLLDLLNAGPIEVVSAGGRDADVYGRKLRLVMRHGQSLGDAMIESGLALRWHGARRNWCR